MEHIGIDLGARRSHIVILDHNGTELERRIVATTELRDLLQSRDPACVVMEACTQSSAVSGFAMSAGHTTFVVPTSVVRALGVGARGIKNDFRDAEALARGSVRSATLPSVYRRSETSVAQRSLIQTRSVLSKTRAMLAVHIKSTLRSQLIVLRGRAQSEAFAKNVREALLATPQGVPASLEFLLSSFEHLSAQLREVDAQVKELAASDPVCKRLMTAPGVGPVIALAYRAQLDDVNRFASSQDLASYLALVPGENTTGGRRRRTGTILAGPRYLKVLLVQGAWSLYTHRPNEPMSVWARNVAARRGPCVAILALARKLATVLYAMWKHEKSYNPALASTARPGPAQA